jgi:hypothetical protein
MASNSTKCKTACGVTPTWDFSNFKREKNSSVVPSAPHNIHHLIDVLSGIGTI